MWKRLFLTVAALLSAGWFPQKAFAAKPIIDRQCYQQIMDNLVISRRDIASYKKIFRALNKDDVETADEHIADVSNQILMGHVLAEKYLSKNYKTSYAELKDWLRLYYDHPQALSLLRLAKSKFNGAKEELADIEKLLPKLPVSPYSWFNNQYEHLSDAKRKYVRQKVSSFRQAINRGKTKVARLILADKNFRLWILDREYDAMSATLATSYLIDGQDKLALQYTEKAIRRSKDATALWVGGLAAWRSGNYRKAADYFGRLGAKTDNDEWLVSAGAYWAYRAYSRLNKKPQANQWLKTASKYKRTFYGMLANYQLRQPWDFNWSGDAYFNNFSTYDYVNDMLASSAIQRAIVLIMSKNPDLAEKELNYAYKNMNERQKEACLYLAAQYNMPALGIKLSNEIKDNEKSLFYDNVAYPVPTWKPKGGWKVSRALVLALIRQESAFKPEAQSGAGAKGLMQLMPNTAYHVTKDRRLKRDSSVLYNADYNMEVGQQYLSYLMGKPFVTDNLFYLATAYNAGPGNLFKWQKKVKYNNDPLLFIEVIPSRETRIYIERVMANFWAYNLRFGKEHKSMDEVASGQWPTL